MGKVTTYSIKFNSTGRVLRVKEGTNIIRLLQMVHKIARENGLTTLAPSEAQDIFGVNYRVITNVSGPSKN